MGGSPAESVAVAQDLADHLLFPAALATDAGARVPPHLLDALGQAGLFGLLGPAVAGGCEADEPTRLAVTEALAGGCLTTTFVWAQHHSAVQTLAAGPSRPARHEWLGPLCRGEIRAGVAFAGLRRPGAPILTARRSGRSWVLQGRAPWVTGWGMVQVIHVAARGPDGEVVWLLADARDDPRLEVVPLGLAAVAASSTVALHFHGLEVGADRLTATEDFDEWKVRDAASLRPNGALALGVADRCCRLLGASPLDQELAGARQQLWAAGTAALPEARARASALAARAAQALVIRGAGRSILLDHHAQRLSREAMFLQVAGQTGAIRKAQLDQLGVSQPGTTSATSADGPPSTA